MPGNGFPGSICASIASAALRYWDASQSSAYTLIAVAAVALGGTSLVGGRGGVIGSLIGAAVIYLLQSLLSGLQVSPTWLQFIYGVMLVLSVVIGALLTMKKKESA